MNLPAVATSAAYCIVIFAWLVYVYSHIYWISLPGLKQVFYVFLLHILYVVICTLMAISRPFWEEEFSDWVWNNKVLCNIHGRFWASCGGMGHFLTTLFSYYKMELYVALKQNPGPCILATRYSMIPGLDRAMPWPIHVGIGDVILNNVIMYWSIFGYINNDFFDANVDGDADSNAIYDFEADCVIEPEYWVCLPGAHPIKVTESVLEANNLREFIVTRRNRLRQIKAYTKRGFIPSLFLCCSNTNDLMDNLEDMGALQDGNHTEKIATMPAFTPENKSKIATHPRIFKIKKEESKKSRLARSAKDAREDPKITSPTKYKEDVSAPNATANAAFSLNSYGIFME